jgi:peroxiredoxin
MKTCGRRAWRSRATAVALLLITIAAFARDALAVTHLKRGMEAPAIALKDENGADLSTARLSDHVAVLMFGEWYHERTRGAWAELDRVLQDARLAGEPIVAVLVTTQPRRAEDLKAWGEARLPASSVVDADRKAFGAFQVAVMPSVVVIDRQGRVVHAIAGAVPRMGDLMADSLLYACGKLSADTLDRSVSLQPSVPASQASEAEVRAGRLVALASQLARRGMGELAAEKYREALQINAKNPPAQLGLGTLLLEQKRLADAEAQFKAVLADQPQSLQATLGVAFVQALRGGAELDEAEAAVRGVLARSPSQARAHYLLGLIAERRNKPQEAAASFKRASELLLERVVVEQE